MAKSRKRNSAAQPLGVVEQRDETARKIHDARAENPSPEWFWFTVAALWWALIIVELGLNLLVAASAFRSSPLPLGVRLTILCYDFAALSGFYVILAAVFFFGRMILYRFFPKLGFRQKRQRIALVALVGFAALLYGATWAKLWHTGKFLSGLDFAFVSPHPVQIFHWIGKDIILIVVGFAVVMALALSHWIPNLLVTLGQPAQRRIAVAAVYGMALFVFGALLGELFSGFGERQYTRSAILYVKSRDESSGPFAHLLSNLRNLPRSLDGEISPSNRPQIITRPIVPMSDYVTSVQTNRVNRWNVILLIVESLRADQLRAYGGRREVMPAIEALSGESRVFSNSYTQASHTDYATVVPLSSHYPLRSTTIHAYPKDPAYPRVLIYDILKAIGYRTAIFSSSNEYWSGMINFLQTGSVERFFHAANFKGPTYVAEGDTGLAQWVKTTKHAGSVDDRFTVGEAIQWIEGLDKNPFFLYVNFQNSHVPYVVPKDFPRRFSVTQTDFPIRFGHIPEDKVEAAKNVYADSLAYVDMQIDRLFRYLKKSGRWENTVVVLTGDHGQAFYEHGFAAHASAIYNEVMKVPLIIRAPQLNPGIDARPAQHVDILPTILALLGLPAHPSAQGVSLVEPRVNENRSIYLVAQTPLAHQYGIVRSRFKLVYDGESRRYALYDLVSDPGETKDVAASHKEDVHDLANRLQTWRKLQIDYYADRTLHSREYPPIIAD